MVMQRMDWICNRIINNILRRDAQRRRVSEFFSSWRTKRDEPKLQSIDSHSLGIFLMTRFLCSCSCYGCYKNNNNFARRGNVLSLCGKWLVCRKCMQFLFSKGKMEPNLANRAAAGGG